MKTYLFTEERLKSELLKATLDDAGFWYIREAIAMTCSMSTPYNKNGKTRFRWNNNTYYSKEDIFIIKKLHLTSISTITTPAPFTSRKSLELVAHDEVTYMILKGIDITSHKIVTKLSFKPKLNLITKLEVSAFFQSYWPLFLLASIAILVVLIETT